jgi:hypothetical protein
MVPATVAAAYARDNMPMAARCSPTSLFRPRRKPIKNRSEYRITVIIKEINFAHGTRLIFPTKIPLIRKKNR